MTCAIWACGSPWLQPPCNLSCEAPCRLHLNPALCLFQFGLSSLWSLSPHCNMTLNYSKFVTHAKRWLHKKFSDAGRGLWAGREQFHRWWDADGTRQGWAGVWIPGAGWWQECLVCCIHGPALHMTELRLNWTESESTFQWSCYSMWSSWQCLHGTRVQAELPVSCLSTLRLEKGYQAACPDRRCRSTQKDRSKTAPHYHISDTYSPYSHFSCRWAAGRKHQSEGRVSSSWQGPSLGGQVAGSALGNWEKAPRQGRET